MSNWHCLDLLYKKTNLMKTKNTIIIVKINKKNNDFEGKAPYINLDILWFSTKTIKLPNKVVVHCIKRRPLAI